MFKLILGAALMLGLQQPAVLRIVVIEGEDTVNVVQQRTAVAAVVEVRDRNNQPVAGAVVRFTIRTGRASFNGARALSVTTDAAGRAVAAGLTPTSSGALQIGAAASFQGQTAAITIAQTNVMTLAQAGAATGAGASGSGGSAGATAGGGGAAGGGGGGLSAAAIGIVGGAVAGGALVATQVLAPSVTEYEGPFSGPMHNTGGPNCSWDFQQDGTVVLRFETLTDAEVGGQGIVEADARRTALNCPNITGTIPENEHHGCCESPVNIVGSKSQLSFTGSHPGGAGTTWVYGFTGAFNGADIVGTFTLTITGTQGQNGTASFPVTLRPR